MNQKEINKAVQILRQGGLVAIPTETVYGLGADAANPEALRKIFLAKQRPMDHPLIVHIADASTLPLWARDIPESAFKLARAFWPGPLTLILKKAPIVSPLVTGNQDTIGIRVPNHPVAQALLQAFGGGVAAPSANRFGRISPTTAQAVSEELGHAVDLILDGGQCDVGVESTIVDVSGDQPAVLRPGMITAHEIEAVLQKPVTYTKKDSPRVSGSLELHYAPRTQTVYIPKEKLSTFLENRPDSELPCVVLSQEKNISTRAGIKNVLMTLDPKVYAHDIYHLLRDLDKQDFRLIVIEAIPEEEEWNAIRDRLVRASARG